MKRWNLIGGLFVIIVSVIILFLFGVYLFSQTRISGDAASHLLLAVSPILKIGSPYKDIWEIKPPVWPLLMYIWSNLFGFSILSMRIMGIIIAVLLTFISYLIYKKVFRTPVFEIIFLCTIVVILSPILNSIMLSTELLGLLLSLCGLYVLISFRKDFPRFYFSGILFFAASQTKEPFTFTVLAMLPVFFESLLRGGFPKLIKNAAQFLFGVLTILTVIYIYLASLGSQYAYVEIFKYKQFMFPFTFEKLSQNFLPGFYAAERTFTEFSRGFSILIILFMVSFYLVNKFKKTLSFNFRKSQLMMKQVAILDSGKVTKCAAFFYAFGSFLGFGLGNSYGSHYLIQIVVPFYIMGGLIVSYLFDNVLFLYKRFKLAFWFTMILFIFSIFIIIPKRQYLSSYLPESTNFIMTDNKYEFEKRIGELTTKDQCVLSVYGWGSGENYLYSERRPCTRFFLPNIVTQDWQKKEYAKAIIENPPAVIVYQTKGSDMDIQKFESEVINISKMIKNCYIKDSIEEVVYIPKTKNVEELKNCIRTSGI